MGGGSVLGVFDGGETCTDPPVEASFECGHVAVPQFLQCDGGKAPLPPPSQKVIALRSKSPKTRSGRKYGLSG